MDTSLKIADCDKRILRRLISEHHYSGTCGPITVGYGVFVDRRLRGAITFSAGVGRFANAYCRPARPDEVVELTRLWLHDDLPLNSASRVIGFALRSLRKGRGRFKAVLSYADEYAGHTGTIYQATNWFYMGQTVSNSSKIAIGNLVVNSRSLNSRYGTHSIERLKRLLGREDIRYVHEDQCKHAYVFPLDDDVRPWLECHAQPYPKREKQAMAGPPAQRQGSTDLHAPEANHGS